MRVSDIDKEKDLRKNKSRSNMNQKRHIKDHKHPKVPEETKSWIPNIMKKKEMIYW